MIGPLAGLPLDGLTCGPQVLKNVAGGVAERLVARVIGARPWDSDMPAFRVPGEVATEIDGSPYDLVPDVWWRRQSALVEVKAGIARFFTTERQWRSYAWARTRGGGLPVERPRVFYAFVAYRKDVQPKTPREAVDVVLRGLRYVLVVDASLVERFLDQASYRADQEGPLSPLLGAWSAHWSLRAHQLQAWADAPRAHLDELGLTRWRVSDLSAAWSTVADDVERAGWARPPVVPAVVLAPCRSARVAPGVLRGGQVSMVRTGLVDCACGYTAPAGTCPGCGEFNAF